MGSEKLRLVFSDTVLELELQPDAMYGRGSDPYVDVEVAALDDTGWDCWRAADIIKVQAFLAEALARIEGREDG